MANLLAIAAPYLIAAALFVVLERSTPPAPQPSEITESPTSSASGASVPVVANSSDASAQPADRPQIPPQNSPAPAAHTKREVASAPPPVAAQKPPVSRDGSPIQPVPVDPAVASTMKLAGAAPAYPAVAQAAGIQGTVVVALTIGPNGSVRDAQGISGPALLQPATIAAVRSWRYRPWLVYGKAVPFETQVSIHFTINGAPSGP